MKNQETLLSSSTFGRATLGSGCSFVSGVFTGRLTGEGEDRVALLACSVVSSLETDATAMCGVYVLFGPLGLVYYFHNSEGFPDP